MGARGPKPVSLPDRLWARVKRGTETECWLWQGSRASGYGRINVNGKSERAHRVAYELTFGPIPPGAHICHHCDNPPCCNPRFGQGFTKASLARMYNVSEKAVYKIVTGRGWSQAQPEAAHRRREP